MTAESLKQLKELLEGAKVLEVRENTSPESLCDLYVEKNRKKYSFTLKATDLGWWSSDVKSQNGKFKVFQDLIEKTFDHYNEHGLFGQYIYESCDSPLDRSIGFRCKKCGAEFCADLATVRNSEYNDLLTTVEKRKTFAKLLSDFYIQDKASTVKYLEELEREKGKSMNITTYRSRPVKTSKTVKAKKGARPARTAKTVKPAHTNKAR